MRLHLCLLATAALAEDDSCAAFAVRKVLHPNGTLAPASAALPPPLCDDCVPLEWPHDDPVPDQVRCEPCPAPPCGHAVLPRCRGEALLLWREDESVEAILQASAAAGAQRRTQEAEGYWSSLWRNIWDSAREQSELFRDGASEQVQHATERVAAGVKRQGALIGRGLGYGFGVLQLGKKGLDKLKFKVRDDF